MNKWKIKYFISRAIREFKNAVAKKPPQFELSRVCEGIFHDQTSRPVKNKKRMRNGKNKKEKSRDEDGDGISRLIEEEENIPMVLARLPVPIIRQLLIATDQLPGSVWLVIDPSACVHIAVDVLHRPLPLHTQL
jgi:hypothetical protein